MLRDGARLLLFLVSLEILLKKVAHSFPMLPRGPSVHQRYYLLQGFRLHSSGKNNDNNGQGNDETEFWNDRWEGAEKDELRADATLVSIHTLARFLAYDVTLPMKAMPGMEIADVVAVLDTLTSALVLALLWTAAGLVTRLFDQDTDVKDVGRVLQTTMLAAPPWLALEIVLGWPAFESSSVVERILLGCLGLFATMSLARLASSSFFPR